MQPDLIGGRYRVQEAIGQGGMGTVWLCRDERLHRDVAVKQVGLLPGESVTDSARALREARSSAALSHRNVVTVFDVIEEDGRIWMVMENVPSRSLSELIRDEGPLPAGRVASIGAQVADGLASAHAAGITHRDVKPGNVLVREDGSAKISDFGIARTAGDPALTQSDMFIGTPSYFSPELARGAEPDPAADVWALGATLYAAVEGRPPFEQKSNAVAVISEIANQPPPPPKRAGELEPVLQRMLDSNPRSRWSMADAAHALHRLADRHADPTPTRAATTLASPAPRGAVSSPPTTAEPSGPARGGSPTPPGRQRRRWPFVLVAALVLLLVGGVALATLTRDDDSTASPRASEPSSSAGSASPSPSDSPRPSPSQEPSRTASPAGSSAAGSNAAGFVRDYFAVVPTDLDTGWSRLSPRMQAEVGRSSFDGFWSTVSSVRTSELSSSADGSSVDVTLRYTMDDGRVSVERHRIDLVRDAGQFLIDDDTPTG